MRIEKLNNKPYLKAFTIIEMLVVMLLSAIVVGLTYLYFTQFQNYITRTNISDDVYQTYSRFSMVLKKDLDEATCIFSPELYELELITNNEKTEYWFDEQRVIRNKKDVLDTFPLLTGELQLKELTKHQGLIKA